jgi:hypothetical protein
VGESASMIFNQTLISVTMLRPEEGAPCKLLEKYYPVLPSGLRYRDGTAPFYQWMLSSIDPSTAVHLNIGAGATPWCTFYRLSTCIRLRKSLLQAGFEHPEFQLIEPEPSYLAFNSWLFRAGVFYERVVNRFEWLSCFRHVILCKANKVLVYQ